MEKVQSVSIPEFMQRGFPPSMTVPQRVGNHFRRHGATYLQISGIAITILIMGAADPSTVTASLDPSQAVSGPEQIDVKAHHIYDRLCLIGKWIIVIRGGVDIISSMSQGELDSMKKKIISYVVGYLALLGLPWILDQASLLFDGSTV